MVAVGKKNVYMQIFKKIKRPFLLICIGAFTLPMHSQDIVIKKNGDEISTKVTKVSDNEIEYKKWANLDGPVYTMQRNDILLIKYANGEKDIFVSDDKQQQTKQQSNDGAQYIKEKPAENNQLLIDTYKTPIHFAKTPKEKDAHYFFPIMAMSDSSIISTSNIEMKIIPTVVWNDDYGSYDIKYAIELHNKTGQILYIDLANSFRIFTDGTSKSYFSTEQTTVTHGNSSGAGLNIGGISNVLGIGGALGTLANATTVGGSSQHSASTTYTSQRILAIPPHSKKNLTEFKQVKIKKHNYKTISDLECYKFYKFNLRGVLKKDGHISYSEVNSPYTAQYIITYSTSQDFSKYSSLYAKLYARYVYGGFWSTLLETKQNKAIKQIQEYIPDFWENKGIIIGGSSYMPKE